MHPLNDAIMTTILLDPGHGSDTPGKRSPDGHFREYAYNRYLAIEIRNRLTALGLDARILVPEQNDIPLKERCRRANAVCKEKGSDNVLLISIHINASGNGSRWMTARGWSAFTTKGNTKADTLATCLYAEAEKYLPNHKIRKDQTDGDPDLEENYYILRHTLCPAVLTENLFMDNPEDLAFLESDTGSQAIIKLHIEGIRQYLAQQ